MELEELYSMLAKNIIYEIKQKKESIIKKFFKNFSCKSSCAISEDDHFDIIMDHIKKLEDYKNKMLEKQNKIAHHSIV